MHASPPRIVQRRAANHPLCGLVLAVLTATALPSQEGETGPGRPEAGGTQSGRRDGNPQDPDAQDRPSAIRREGEAPQDPDGTRGVQGETPREAIAIPSDVGGGERVFELTLYDALRLGRLNNLSLKAAALTPLQLREDLRVDEAFFEPELFGSANIGRSQDPPRNIFQPAITRETINGNIGMRQRLVTGGLYELTFTPLRVKQQTNTPGFPSQLYTMEAQAQLTQPLLRGAWTESTLSEVRRSEAALEAGNARLERTVQDTLIQIVEAYWELVFSREDYRVTYQALELAREQLRITSERIRVRELAERDRVFDEAQVALRREELIRAENEIRRREDALRQQLFDDSDGLLWNRNLRPVSAIEGNFAVPKLDWREAARSALQLRPDLRALRADVRRAEVAYERAWRDVLPQLDLVGSYSTDGAQASSNKTWEDVTSLEFPDWSVGLTLSVPIGNNAARGARDAAAFALEQSRRQLYAAELDVTREVRDALRDLGTLAESVLAASESVRLSETQLDTERERLRVGRGTIFEVQQRNQELLDARQRLLRNQLDYRIGESRLLHVQGILQAPGWGERADAGAPR